MPIRETKELDLSSPPPKSASAEEVKRRRLSNGKGLRSPANDDSDNDDETEMKQIRKSKALQARRQTIGTPTKAAAAPKPEVKRPPKEKAADGKSSLAEGVANLAAGQKKLSKAQVSQMYDTVLKLAQQNKITSKNAWSLSLIDYIDEAIALEDEQDASGQLNFQRASCTLDASVKIYSSRVDNVHKETFKVLGGLTSGRSGEGGADDDDDSDSEKAADGADGAAGAGEGAEKKAKKGASRRGASTLVPAASLNVKKFDLAFEVDPLFQKTSAQFDEGGARGLLLNNLGVFSGCNLAFDSSEVYQSQDGDDETQQQSAEKLAERARLEHEAGMDLDLSELVSVLKTTVGGGEAQLLALDICPLLGELREMRDKLASGASLSPQKPVGGKQAEKQADSDDDEDNDNEPMSADIDLEAAIAQQEKLVEQQQSQQASGAMLDAEFAEAAGDAGDFGGAAGDDGGDFDGSVPLAIPALQAAQQAAGVSASARARTGDDMMLAESEAQASAGGDLELLGGGVSLGLRSWAGVGHWKFKPTAAGGSGAEAKKKGGRGKKEKTAFFIDFFAEPVPESAFAPPARATNQLSKAALARADADPNCNLLPEDVHYRAQHLQTLFTKPRVLVRLRLHGKAAGATSSSSSAAAGDGLVASGGDNSGEAVAGIPSDTASLLMFNDAPAGSSAMAAAAADGGAGDVLQYADGNSEAPMPFADGGADAGGDDMDDESPDGSGFSLARKSEIGFAGIGLAESGDGINLIAQPERVQKIDIRYARFAKKVDVRGLKDCLWEKLQESKQKSPAKPDASVELTPKSFQSAITSLQGALPAQALDNISVSFCFICVLHLANEKGLTLMAGAAPAADSAEARYQAANCPADVGTNLGDFIVARDPNVRPPAAAAAASSEEHDT